MIIYASDFNEIPNALSKNPQLKEKMLSLIGSKKIAGKATDGAGRAEEFRVILSQLTKGELRLDEAIRAVEARLPRYTSIHSDDNRVFASGWAERLTRTQFSRFYNQAVLEIVIANGHNECFVPPSSQEKASSQCSQVFAGRSHDVSHLLKLLVASYEDGNWDNTPKIPDHPHCTHVIKPMY